MANTFSKNKKRLYQTGMKLVAIGLVLILATIIALFNKAGLTLQGGLKYILLGLAALVAGGFLMKSGAGAAGDSRVDEESKI